MRGQTEAMRGQLEAVIEATKPPPPPPEPPTFPALHEVPGTRYMEELRETDPKLLEAPDWDTYYYAFEKLFTAATPWSISSGRISPIWSRWTGR